MADSRKVLGVLQGARELVCENWGTKNMEVPFEVASGAFCASVAICSVGSLDHEALDAAHRAFLVAAGCEVPADTEPFGAVYTFNDAQTSVAPVLAAFDRAIGSMATPDADAALEVMAACDEAGAVVARQIVAQHPQMDVGEISTLASAELFYAAQDTAQACAVGVKLERA